MAVDRVDRKPDNLDAALVELGLEAGHGAELGGADRREILGMREQHGPVVADPVVETDLAFSRIGLEIRGGVANLERHENLHRGCPMREYWEIMRPIT